MPPDNIPRTRNDSSRHYLAPIAHSVTGPILLSAYVFALWSLAADIGLTHSFPWSAGPLSSWFIWLAVALLLTLVASTLPWNRPAED
jgi:multisubunit Na+/H+ antiporter MnhB subunit